MNRLTNKKTLKEILEAYDRQIRKNMGFWIKYRPSRWGDLLPEKFIRPLLTIIKTKGGKKFVLILAFLLSLIFVGVIPTLSFIWSKSRFAKFTSAIIEMLIATQILIAERVHQYRLYYIQSGHQKHFHHNQELLVL